MAWWGWIAVGALLLATELGFVDTGFYLVFLGLSALLVGLVSLAGLGGPVWAQWLLFAAVAAASLVLFRERVYSRLQRRGVGRREGLDGESVIASERIEAAARGRAELHGSQWTVVNAGATPISAGERARVLRVDGLVLHVEKSGSGEPTGR